MSPLQIKAYRDFWDFPRLFIIELNDGNLLLFDCKFNDETEDYDDVFQVYLIPPIGDEEMLGSWANLSMKAIRYVGEVGINELRFDDTKRKYIDDAILDFFSP